MGTKLLLTTLSAYILHVDCVWFCDLLKTQHYCLSSNGRHNPPLAAHVTLSHHPRHLLIRVTSDIYTVFVKKLLKIQ